MSNSGPAIMAPVGNISEVNKVKCFRTVTRAYCFGGTKLFWEVYAFCWMPWIILGITWSEKVKCKKLQCSANKKNWTCKTNTCGVLQVFN